MTYSMTQIIPFVLFRIVVIDDYFVLVLGAYYETNPLLPFKERIREASCIS
jgi:hypothetical protein